MLQLIDPSENIRFAACLPLTRVRLLLARHAGRLALLL